MKFFPMIVALAVVTVRDGVRVQRAEDRPTARARPCGGSGDTVAPGFCRLHAAGTGDDDRLSLILRS
jgi:hypothetical protein